MAGAAVLLGLTPTILSAIGPSSSEMALLFTHRPVLALLITFGAPSIFPARPGEYADPTESLRLREGARKALLANVINGRGTACSVSLLQYVLVGGAVANALQTVLEIGTHGIVSYRCNSTLLPFVWMMWPIFIHGVAVLSYCLSNTRALSQANRQHAKPVHATGAEPRSWWQAELMPCATHVKPRVAKTDEPWFVLFLNYTASFLGLIHIVFGTLVFSALLFINITRALEIVLRLILSALACHVVLSFEISGLRDPGQASEPGAEATPKSHALQTLSYRP